MQVTVGKVAAPSSYIRQLIHRSPPRWQNACLSTEPATLKIHRTSYSKGVNDSQRERLIELVNQLAIKRGRFTLASGRESSYYVDMRRATLHHEAGPLIGHVMLDMLEEAGFGPDDVDAVGGLTMGADPVATAIMHAAASRGLDIDAFVVRKEAKDHGMKRQIEGPDIAGRDVVILEDTSTTGGSPIQALEAARAAGAHVLAVAVVVDRATGARERIEAYGVPYLAALQLDDLGLEPQL